MAPPITPPTQVTITKTDSTTDVLTIPAGIDYAAFVHAIAQGGGYWDATGLTFVPLPFVKKIVAS